MQIDELLSENPDLRPLYYQEIGRLDSLSMKKCLKESGITEGWFAMLDGDVVASGMTKEELDDDLRKEVPPERLDEAYIFEMR